MTNLSDLRKYSRGLYADNPITVRFTAKNIHTMGFPHGYIRVNIMRFLCVTEKINFVACIFVYHVY